MSSSFQSFGIIGAGAWGTALAVALHRAGRNVTLAARDPQFAAALAKTRENEPYLPGIKLDPAIDAVSDMAGLAFCDAVIMATPAQTLRATCKALAPTLKARQPIIIASKGVELGTHRLMSEVVAEEMADHPVFILSGPSFAGEVAQNLPAALTLAGEARGDALALAMTSPAFRLYTTDDIIGTQVGGALKNVLAIACGIVAGRNLGENARAALITRGLAEIVRLGTALGGRAETLMGLSGLGDVALTCSSQKSRNMSLGIALGHNENIAHILTTRAGVTEGVATATAALGLAYRHGIDMPVTSAVDRILREKADIDDMIAELLARPLRTEAA
ncbi:MAG: NAD(P)-dependent glycerol-3-phosphate dehydrogenase [Alphaproteobacteria bacterium]|nr:NAD(P)-dependent glycerol-3-phosphate dehydrogenase [Alphaproteobacteria bacterium]